jgi:NADPH:quinone reductase-like Zn-dependent oxidoreductase
MRAVHAPRFGGPDVLTLAPAPDPAPGPADVLVQVHASALTQGDRRIRAADFGGLLALPGHLMFGWRRPRHPIPGTTFAGRIVEVGSGAEGWQVGQDVFGLTLHGAHADLLRMPASGAVAPMPAGLTHVEAAGLSYGAGTALHMLRAVGRVQPGDHVVVVGAAGGVGRPAVVDSRALLDDVGALVAAGLVRSTVAATFPLEAIVEAHRWFESTRPPGDVVVTMR